MPLLRLSFLLLFCLATMTPGAHAADPEPWLHPDGTTHWYEVVSVTAGIDWLSAHRAAIAKGGHLVTITSKAENDIVFQLVDDAALWKLDSTSQRWAGPWIGGVQDSSSTEPKGGWGWTEAEAFSFEQWATGEPNNNSKADRVHFGGASTGRTADWADAPATSKLLGYVIEYDGALVPRTLGLLERKPGSFDGYTLMAPTRALVTYLIDPRGRIVNWWASQHMPGIVAYLLPSGNLLRTGNANNPDYQIGGTGGIVQEFDWDGNLVWDFSYSTKDHCQHHDIERLPNGNILMVAWERISEAEALAAGRDPKLLPDKRLYPDKIVEIVPTGPKSGQVVWEWRAWDHIVQDFDKTKPNYGKPADNQDRVDLNYVAYNGRDDWMHVNAVAYNPKLDQIAISVRSFDEVWIIDHSTTTAEAKTASGGRSGKGGRLLYRYGNPMAYGRGTLQDQKLFKQHDVHWVEEGLPGAGNLLIFNNGTARLAGNYSSVDEVTPPAPDGRGRYPLRANGTWGPDKLTWTYQAPNPTDFYSMFVSGAQRQPNGNTMICAGWLGETFEVTPKGEIVWRYMNPVQTGAILHQGHAGAGGEMVFRSYRYGPRFGAFANKTLEPGDPVETYSKGLLANGSMLDLTLELGDEAELEVISDGDADRFYLLGTSMTPGTMSVGHRAYRIGYDALVPFSMAGSAPAIFQGYFGRLDAKGRAEASFTVPEMTWLKGLSFYTAFMVFDPAAPKGISTLSNTIRIDVAK